MYLQVLKAMLERENWKIAHEHFDRKYVEEQNPQAVVLMDILNQYYKDREGNPDLNTLKEYHLTSVLKNAKVDSKPRKDAEALYEMLSDVDVDESVMFYINKLELTKKTYAIGEKLVEQASNPDKEALLEILDEAKASLGEVKDDDTLSLPSVEEFCHRITAAHKWQMPFNALNMRTQGFGGGRTMLVFALSNVGKSSFCLSLASKFIQQGARVLDLSITEDPFSRRVPRLMQCLFDVDYPTIKGNQEEYYQQFLNEYGDKYAFVYDAGMTIRHIRKYCETFNPDIVIVDNFTKINRKGRQELNHAKTIGLNLADLKGLAEEYDFGCIPVCQAADSARGKTVLSMQDIADSKVDVPGELEIAVGVAASEHNAGMLYFTMAKNKLDPRPDAPVPDYFTLNFNKSTGRFWE